MEINNNYCGYETGPIRPPSEAESLLREYQETVLGISAGSAAYTKTKSSASGALSM